MGLFGKKGDEIPEIGSEDLGAGEEHLFGTGLEKEDSSFESIQDDSSDSGTVFRGRTPSSRKKKSFGSSSKSVSPSREFSGGNLNNYSSSGFSGNSSGNVQTDLKLQKIEARMESMQEFIKNFSERLSVLNQQIGEVRSSSLTNEKNINKISLDSTKAIELVRDVQPEKLRIDYQKLEARIQAVDEKISMQKEMVSNVLSEFDDFKRKSEVFIGTEGLLKLNQDIQKDLVQAQKVASMVKLNADKCQNIFTEVSRGFAESEKKNQMVSLLERNYSDLKKQIQESKLISSNFTTREDLARLMGNIDVKFKEILQVYDGYNKMIEYNQNLGRLVQKLFLLHQENADKLKDLNILSEGERLEILEHRLDSLLEMVGKMSREISRIKGIGITNDLNNSDSEPFL